MSKENIDETLIFLMDELIAYNIDKNAIIHPKTIEARNYLLLNR